MNPIHKPADRLVKDFADEAPRVFLHVLGVVSLGDPARIEVQRQETAPPVRLPDWVAVVTLPRRKPFILHIEFLLNYKRTTPRTMARYGGSLAWQYNRPVTSLLLLLRAKGVPEHVPELGVCQIGETRTTHPFRAARMDLLDPTMLLESGNPRLFPWAVLMNSTDDQVRRIGRELAAIGDEESRGRFRMAATIRYDRNAVRRILGESDMGFLEVIKQGSFLCVEAREEGKAEGKAEGSVATARAMLRRYLKSKLPGLEAMPEIDAISSGPMLESLVDELVIESAGRARMRNAILSAARKG